MLGRLIWPPAKSCTYSTASPDTNCATHPRTGTLLFAPDSTQSTRKNQTLFPFQNAPWWNCRPGLLFSVFGPIFYSLRTCQSDRKSLWGVRKFRRVWFGTKIVDFLRRVSQTHYCGCANCSTSALLLKFVNSPTNYLNWYHIDCYLAAPAH